MLKPSQLRITFQSTLTAASSNLFIVQIPFFGHLIEEAVLGITATWSISSFRGLFFIKLASCFTYSACVLKTLIQPNLCLLIAQNSKLNTLKTDGVFTAAQLLLMALVGGEGARILFYFFVNLVQRWHSIK